MSGGTVRRDNQDEPYKLVAVALANKIARVIWALLAKGGTYRKPQPAVAAA